MQDHDCVKGYPAVKGMQQPLFFWDHDNKEGGSDSETRSKFNSEEAVMAAKLAKYLVQQGYRWRSCTHHCHAWSCVYRCPYVELQCIREALRMPIVIHTRADRGLLCKGLERSQS